MKLGAGNAGGISEVLQFIKSARGFWLVLSIVLTYAGLHVMQETIPVIIYPPLLDFLQSWHNRFQLQIINLPNLLIGSIIALIGSVIFVKSIHRAKDADDNFSFRESAETKLDWKSNWSWLTVALALYGILLVQLADHKYSFVSLLFWIAPLVCFSFLLWKRDRASIDLCLDADWMDGALMLLLFAFAIGCGAYLLDVIPAYLIPDEGTFWETANSIAIGIHQPAIFDFGVYSFPVASSIFQAAVMRFTEIDLWGWRFSSVLAASLTVFPLYLLAKEWFGRRAAVITCLLLTTNPYFLSFARLGYNNSQALFPVTLTILFLVLGLRRGSRFYLWMSGLAAGLGFYTYFSAWLGVVVLVITLAALPFTDKIKFRHALLLLLVALAGWVAFSAPRMVYGMSSGLGTSFYYKVAETSMISGFYGRTFFGETAINEVTTWKVGQVEAFYHLPYYGIFLVRGAIRSLAALVVPNLYRDHFLVAELVGPGRSIFFILGLAIAASGLRSMRGVILNTWFWLGLFFLSVLGAFPPRPTHLVAILPALALLTAYGLNSVIKVVIERAQFLPFARSIWERVASLAIVIILCSSGLTAYFSEMPLAYPPDFDRASSWLARSISRPVTVVFIEDESTQHDVAYQSKVGLTNHYVLGISRADIPSLAGIVKAREFMAFISNENADGSTLLSLSNLFPNASTLKITDTVDSTLGYVVSNISLAPARNPDLKDGLRDLWNSPALTILLSSILAATFMMSMAWTRNGGVVGVESHWPNIDIYLRIRIQFPRRQEAMSQPETGTNQNNELP